ncbi:S41 family peptidase [Halomonas denitrificans]|nr:hypothetical protein [Halomonas denitrificans]
MARCNRNRCFITSVFVVLAGAAFASSEDQQAPIVDREIDVVRAVGVVRYFHPHEAVTRVDWNHVLHRGFELAAADTTDEEFARSLRRWLAPIGRDIARVAADDASTQRTVGACRDGERPVRWVHEGVTADPAVPLARVYRSRRSGHETGGHPYDHVVFTKWIDAAPLRGKELAYTGRIRMPAGGEGVLWIRVDGPDREQLFYDNMYDRPVTGPEWSAKGLVVPIPDRAVDVHFGTVVYGTVPAEFDQLQLRVFDEQADQPVGESLIEDPGTWRVTSDSQRHVHQVVQREDGIAIRVTIAPADEPESEIVQELQDGAPVDWTVELVDGSFLRVPLALCPEIAELEARDRERLWQRYPGGAVDRLSPSEQAKLDVAATWGVMQHFYPYRSMLDDWPQALRAALIESRAVEDRDHHLRLLQRLLHHIDDGHVSVYETDPAAEAPQAFLPLAVERVPEGLVVAVSNESQAVRPGDLVLGVDGEAIETWMARALVHESGSLQWRTFRAIEDLLLGPAGEQRMLSLERDGSRFDATLEFSAPGPVRSIDYPVLRELGEGIVHVFLPAIRQEGVASLIPRLMDAEGIVFDLRGYPNPTFVPAEFLGHFLDAPDDWTAWLQVLLARAPDGDLVASIQDQFALPVAEPRVNTPTVFLADHRALSYAESLVGVIKRHGIGPIVGAPTAGANGNVIPLVLPGGFTASFTGMRVLGPDGSPFHAQGIEPDVAVGPTRSDLQAERDVVLERAIDLLHER